MTQVVQVVWVVQVVRVAKTTSLDDSENIWFSWYKPSKYPEKLICHACDGGRMNEGGKWKIVQCSVEPETAISTLTDPPFTFFAQISKIFDKYIVNLASPRPVP